ncbi:hypothetical protein P3L10_032047 [Capsicum annuum]
MRTLKWDPMFNPEEETTYAVRWISFPSLPPNCFAKEAVFSLADAVGNPLQVDLATQNKTRSSCARVKLEVDLLGDFPKKINIEIRKKTGEVVEKWIHIKYDYVPKYCKECKLQGHNEKECYFIHPELYPKEDNEEVDEQEDTESQRGQAKNKEKLANTEDKSKAKGTEEEEFQKQKRK